MSDLGDDGGSRSLIDIGVFLLEPGYVQVRGLAVRKQDGCARRDTHRAPHCGLFSNEPCISPCARSFVKVRFILEKNKDANAPCDKFEIILKTDCHSLIFHSKATIVFFNPF